MWWNAYGIKYSVLKLKKDQKQNPSFENCTSLITNAPFIHSFIQKKFQRKKRSILSLTQVPTLGSCYN